VPDLLVTIVDEAKAIGGVIRHSFQIEADQELWIEGDRNQIYSAISNVVFNAVQHTPDQGQISIRWFLAEDGEAILEVHDTGEGISADHIPRITERFYRVDRGRSREKGGTGLGLAIVKHILVRHNAKLEVESKLGQGSTFRFRFPKSLVIRKNIISDRYNKAREIAGA
jgi:two-component system phosphate regulon sensor histidine kinase PhoR